LERSGDFEDNKMNKTPAKHSRARRWIGTGLMLLTGALNVVIPSKGYALNNNVTINMTDLFSQMTPDTMPIEGAVVTLQDYPSAVETLVDTTDANGDAKFIITGISEDEKRMHPGKGQNSYLVGNNVRFNLFSDKNYDLELRLHDISGRAVKTLNTEVKEGNNSIDLELSGLSSGNYFYQMVKGGNVVSRGKLTHTKGGINRNIDLSNDYALNNEDAADIIVPKLLKEAKGNTYKVTITKDGFYERETYVELSGDTTVHEDMADTLKMPEYFFKNVIRALSGFDMVTKKWLTQPRFFIDTSTVYTDSTGDTTDISVMTQAQVDTLKSAIREYVPRFTAGHILGDDSLITVGDHESRLPDDGQILIYLDPYLPLRQTEMV
jgi:hypothetical protein